MKQLWSLQAVILCSYCFHLLYGNSAAVLTSNATVVCPGDTITFTCSVPGHLVIWAMYTPQLVFVSIILGSGTRSITRTTSSGLRLQAVLTGISGGVITATLTNLNDISFGYGDAVACTGKLTQTALFSNNLTITRPDPPSAIDNLTWTAETVSPSYSTINLTWDHIPQQNISVSYVITLFPPPPFESPVTVETTFVFINVSYNTQYNVAVRAQNCAGSSTDTLTLISIASCTVPVELTNGTITATLVDGTTVDYDSLNDPVLEGTVLTYQCDNGLTLFGSVNITCMGDGEWSSDPGMFACSDTLLSVSIVNGIIAAIVIIISLSCIIVCGRIYKRRKLLRRQQLATDSVLRYDLAALPASTIKPFYPLSTLFDDTQESTLSSTTEEVITSLNNTDVPCPLESPPPETMPRSPTTAHTAQVSIDGHHSSISEPSTGTVKAEGSVEEASSAIANAWSVILGSNEMKLLNIPGSQLKLNRDPIGQGETGMVYKGLLMNWKDEPVQGVAVKTLKGLFSSADIQFLISEIIKMKDFNHPHVMPLIGVCLDAGPGVSMVMPHMTNGSVLEYLKKERSGLKLTDNCSKEKAQAVRKLLLRMCHQISLGMEYLSQQKFIHRDLAARNCMLDSSGNVRVGDFGLAEDVYSTGYFRQNERADIKLPYKWMALESLNDTIFTEKTDVWSYGVTMWEVFSGGQNPYPGVDVMTLVKFIQRGSRLDAPVNAACTTEISAVMQRCWLEDSEERPSFTDLSSIMDAMLSSVSDYAELNMKLPHNSQDPIIDMSGYDDLNESLRNRPMSTN